MNLRAAVFHACVHCFELNAGIHVYILVSFLSPGLLDALHPLVAVGLFLCPQLQRFLPVVAKDDQEVVLHRRKNRRNIIRQAY